MSLQSLEGMSARRIADIVVPHRPQSEVEELGDYEDLDIQDRVPQQWLPPYEGSSGASVSATAPVRFSQAFVPWVVKVTILLQLCHLET